MNNNTTRQPWQDRWGKSAGEVFKELLRERGIAKYAYIYSSTEGTEFPSGLEAHSFWILTPDGKVWDYTIDWDPEKLNPDGEKGYYKLREPREASGWEHKPDYLRARRELGLPLTEEQQKTLQKEEEHKVR